MTRTYIRHGMTHTAEYRIWQGILQRCTNPRSTAFAYYGGRGISVHPRWRSFTSFLDDVGSRPSTEHSLDRIDNDRGYEPGNCQWATRSQQQRNRRDNLIANTDQGPVLVADLLTSAVVTRESLFDRLQKGIPLVEALQTPQFRVKRSGTTSRFLGVSWDASRNKWTASTRRDGKRVNLGRFDREEDAAVVASRAAADA